MINLLPDHTKLQLRAARVNVILLRYIFIIVLAFAFIILIIAGSSFLLMVSKASSEQLIEANDGKARQYSQTQAEIAALSGNLSGAKSILDQQVSYAKFLRTLGQSMSPGTVISGVTLDEAALNGNSIELTIYAVSTDATVALRQQLQSNRVFSSVNLNSISEEGGIPGYPVSAKLILNINRTAL